MTNNVNRRTLLLPVIHGPDKKLFGFLMFLIALYHSQILVQEGAVFLEISVGLLTMDFSKALDKMKHHPLVEK